MLTEPRRSLRGLPLVHRHAAERRTGPPAAASCWRMRSCRLHADEKMWYSSERRPDAARMDDAVDRGLMGRGRARAIHAVRRGADRRTRYVEHQAAPPRCERLSSPARRTSDRGVAGARPASSTTARSSFRRSFATPARRCRAARVAHRRRMGRSVSTDDAPHRRSGSTWSAAASPTRGDSSSTLGAAGPTAPSRRACRIPLVARRNRRPFAWRSDHCGRLASGWKLDRFQGGAGAAGRDIGGRDLQQYRH